MFDKISFYKIIKAHLSTLRSLKENRLLKRDYFLFYVMPAIFGILLVYSNVYMAKDVIANLIAAMSIFAGFLFNLLAIVYGLVDKIKANIQSESERAIKSKLINEVHSNISYNIIVSVFLVVLLIIALFLPICKIYDFHIPKKTDFSIASALCISSLLTHALIYLFLANFILTLLMILQRVHILLRREMSN